MNTSGYRRLRKPAPGSEQDSFMQLGSSMDKYVTRSPELDSLVAYDGHRDRISAAVDTLSLSNSVLPNSFDSIIQQRMNEFESRISGTLMQLVDSRMNLLQGSINDARAAMAQDVRNNVIEVNAMKAIQSDLVQNLSHLRQSVTESLSHSQERTIQSMATVQKQTLTESHDLKAALNFLQNELQSLKTNVATLFSRAEAIDLATASQASNMTNVQRKVGQLEHHLETLQLSNILPSSIDDASSPHPTSSLITNSGAINPLSPIRGGRKGQRLASFGATPLSSAGSISPVPMLLDSTVPTDGVHAGSFAVQEFENKLASLQTRVNIDLQSRLTQFEGSVISNLNSALMQMDSLRNGLQRDQQVLVSQLMDSVRGTMNIVTNRTSDLSHSLSELQQTIPLLARCLEEEVKTRTRTMGLLNDKIDTATQSWKSLSSSLSSSLIHHWNSLLSSAIQPVEQQVKTMDTRQETKNTALGQAVYAGLEKEATLRRALEKRMFEVELAIYSLKSRTSPSNDHSTDSEINSEPNSTDRSKREYDEANSAIAVHSNRNFGRETAIALPNASPLEQKLSKQYRELRSLLESWSAEGLLDRIQELETTRREDMAALRSLRRQFKQLEIEVRVTETHRDSEEANQFEKQETREQRLRILESRVAEAMRGLQAMQMQLGIFDISESMGTSSTIIEDMRKEIKGVVSGMQGMQQRLMSKIQDLEAVGKDNQSQLQTLSLTITPMPTSSSPMFVSPATLSNMVTSTTPGMAPSAMESSPSSAVGNAARSPGIVPDFGSQAIVPRSNILPSPGGKVTPTKEQLRLTRLEEQQAGILAKVSELQAASASSNISSTFTPTSIEDTNISSSNKASAAMMSELVVVQNDVKALRQEMHDLRVYLEQLVAESKFSAMEHTDHAVLDLEANMGREIDELWDLMRSSRDHIHLEYPPEAVDSLVPSRQSQRESGTSARSRRVSKDAGTPQLPPLAPFPPSSGGNSNQVSHNLDLTPAPPLSSLAVSPPEVSLDLFTVSVDRANSTPDALSLQREGKSSELLDEAVPAPMQIDANSRGNSVGVIHNVNETTKVRDSNDPTDASSAVFENLLEPAASASEAQSSIAQPGQPNPSTATPTSPSVSNNPMETNLGDELISNTDVLLAPNEELDISLISEGATNMATSMGSPAANALKQTDSELIGSASHQIGTENSHSFPNRDAAEVDSNLGDETVYRVESGASDSSVGLQYTQHS